jgi:Transcriptional regulators
MVTIYDVARIAGVSRSTVSRVLNNRKEVNEETRAKVQAAIRKLNYSPNVSAQVLASQTTNTLGVVSFGMKSFYSSFMDGIYYYADEMGYGVIFGVNNPVNKTRVNYLNMMNGRVDGIIFLGETVTPTELVRLLETHYPLVLIESDIRFPGVLSVNIDNYHGAYQATKHLIQLGHKKIAHIMGNPESTGAMDRLKGYSQALEDHRLETSENLIKTGNYLFNDGYRAARELLDESPGIEAVFCANDNMAIAFIKAAFEKGLKIPEDISVVGFDDVSDQELFIKNMPRLTTIRQPYLEMAKYAVEALIQLINNKEEALGNQTFKGELIIRDSTRLAGK